MTLGILQVVASIAAVTLVRKLGRAVAALKKKTRRGSSQPEILWANKKSDGDSLYNLGCVPLHRIPVANEGL